MDDTGAGGVPVPELSALDIADDLSEARRESIRNALAAYRATILIDNLAALRSIVDSLEQTPAPPRTWDGQERTAEEAKQFRIRYLRDEYRLLPHGLKLATVRDILADNVRDEIIACGRLDGIDHGPVDLENRQRWWAAIWSHIAQLDLQHRPEGLPADMVYLSTLVRGIPGPFTPGREVDTKFPLLVELDEAMYDMQNYGVSGRMLAHVPADQLREGHYDTLSLLWADDWEISVCVQLGENDNIASSGCYALYSRPKGDQRNGGWQWRYALQDEQYDGPVFDSVEDFLAWHATSNAVGAEAEAPLFDENDDGGGADEQE